jgi:hypothetical protein
VRILKEYFGPHHAFDATAPAVPGVTRTFSDFDAFATDGQLGRIVGGMHFRTAVDEGLKQGRMIGNWILEEYLRPLR